MATLPVRYPLSLFREVPILENDAVPEDEEQTWPSEAEMADTTIAHRRLAPGTSDYQACWIVDADDAPSDEDAAGSDQAAPALQPLSANAGAVPGGRVASRGAEPSEAATPLDVEMDVSSDAEGTVGEGGGDGEESASVAEVARVRRQWRQQAADDDLQYPDEVEVSPDMRARVRSVRVCSE
jgi:pre-rRNA-processing protein TSR1